MVQDSGLTPADTFLIHVCVDYPRFQLPSAKVHEIWSTSDDSAYSEESSLVLQTQEKGHSSRWTLLHPASGSTDPILSLELGRQITVFGPGKTEVTRLKKQMLSSKRIFTHEGLTYCWRRERIGERHEEFRLVLTLEDSNSTAKLPRGQRSVVAEVRNMNPQVSQLHVYERGSLPVPLLCMTAMVQDFERRQMQAPAPFSKVSLAACT